MSAKKTANKARPPKKVHPFTPPPRALFRFFTVRVHRDGALERIIVSDRGARGIYKNWRWLTVQDAEYVIAQLQRAIKRAPRAR